MNAKDSTTVEENSSAKAKHQKMISSTNEFNSSETKENSQYFQGTNGNSKLDSHRKSRISDHQIDVNINRYKTRDFSNKRRMNKTPNKINEFKKNGTQKVNTEYMVVSDEYALNMIDSKKGSQLVKEVVENGMSIGELRVSLEKNKSKLRQSTSSANRRVIDYQRSIDLAVE